MKLSELADKYPSHKHTAHDYFNRIYNELILPYKDKTKLFVEIGVLSGDSLRIWNDYFDHARIVGVDSNPDIVGSIGRCELIRCDQSKEEDLRSLAPQIQDADIIMDDASHKMYDQQKTLAILFKVLKPGGLYILEDLHTSVECLMPSKAVFGWGDPTKTTTLNMLNNFVNTGKIVSDYMTEEEVKYLEDHIAVCKVYDDRYPDSITSSIVKK